jgi:hypothetical protein
MREEMQDLGFLSSDRLENESCLPLE